MVDWSAWQRSWDRQQEGYLPDREERFRVMLDVVEAFTGTAPRVLDLACGTGTITTRVLRRLPGATTTGVDLDPALLTIARGSTEGDPRVHWVTADLRDPAWPGVFDGEPPFDAVLTATALHWLREEPLRALYGQLAALLRPGGVFLNADHMPDPATPRINAALDAADRTRREAEAARAPDWAGWWRQVAAAPELAAPARERFALLGDPAAGDHADGQAHHAEWHVRTLRAAGFAEARPVWAAPSDGMVLALR